MTHDHHEHDHDHHAGHDHGHSHAPTSFGRVFAIGVTLNLVIVAAELVFGYLANSLSLISDAAHNFTDVVGLLLAWGGAWLAARQPTARYTYGFRRASILAALGNAALLLIATGGILIEALHRFQDPQPVATGTVMAVATLGILVNGATAVMFMSGRKDDLNIKGAFLHMVGDAGISVGVVIGAALVSVTGWLWLDPQSQLRSRLRFCGAAGVLHGIRSILRLTQSRATSITRRCKPTCVACRASVRFTTCTSGR
jgi:cation diffusion facilitator family transporter